MKDVLSSIELKRKQELLIMFDHIIADMINQKLHLLVTELFIKS